MGKVSEQENVAYATVYWYASVLVGKVLFPKAEEAAKTVIDYYATHLTREDALNSIWCWRLYESDYWKSLTTICGKDSTPP